MFTQFSCSFQELSSTSDLTEYNRNVISRHLRDLQKHWDIIDRPVVFFSPRNNEVQYWKNGNGTLQVGYPEHGTV